MYEGMAKVMNEFKRNNLQRSGTYKVPYGEPDWCYKQLLYV